MKKLKSCLTLAKIIKLLNALPMTAFKIYCGFNLGCFVGILVLALLRRFGVNTPASTLVPFTLWGTVIASCLSILFWGYLKLAISNKLRKGPVNGSYPLFAERLLWFFLKPELAEESIEHFNKDFEMHREARGWFFAWCWYWWQLVRLAYPLFKELVGMAVKWVILGWISR